MTFFVFLSLTTTLYFCTLISAYMPNLLNLFALAGILTVTPFVIDTDIFPLHPFELNALETENALLVDNAYELAFIQLFVSTG